MKAGSGRKWKEGREAMMIAKWSWIVDQIATEEGTVRMVLIEVGEVADRTVSWIESAAVLGFVNFMKY